MCDLSSLESHEDWWQCSCRESTCEALVVLVILVILVMLVMLVILVILVILMAGARRRVACFLLLLWFYTRPTSRATSRRYPQAETGEDTDAYLWVATASCSTHPWVIVLSVASACAFLVMSCLLVRMMLVRTE